MSQYIDIYFYSFKVLEYDTENDIRFDCGQF